MGKFSVATADFAPGVVEHIGVQGTLEQLLPRIVDADPPPKYAPGAGPRRYGLLKRGPECLPNGLRASAFRSKRP
jgi:hypothetical protein